MAEVTRKLLLVEAISENREIYPPEFYIQGVGACKSDRYICKVVGELPSAEELGRVASQSVLDYVPITNPGRIAEFPRIGQAILDALKRERVTETAASSETVSPEGTKPE